MSAESMGATFARVSIEGPNLTDTYDYCLNVVPAAAIDINDVGDIDFDQYDRTAFKMHRLETR